MYVTNPLTKRSFLSFKPYPEIIIPNITTCHRPISLPSNIQTTTKIKARILYKDSGNVYAHSHDPLQVDRISPSLAAQLQKQPSYISSERAQTDDMPTRYNTPSSSTETGNSHARSAQGTIDRKCSGSHSAPESESFDRCRKRATNKNKTPAPPPPPAQTHARLTRVWLYGIQDVVHFQQNLLFSSRGRPATTTVSFCLCFSVFKIGDDGMQNVRRGPVSFARRRFRSF